MYFSGGIFVCGGGGRVKEWRVVIVWSLWMILLVRKVEDGR